MFLTTTLPYANSVPHIGHTLEFIQADALSRYFKSSLGKDNVIFNIGLDEHGSKIFERAKELGITPQELVDSLSIKWKEFCELFQIKYDSFYRTSDSSHHEAVKKFWLVCLERGDIYKKSYTGQYCNGCESFKTEKDLVDGKCPDHFNTEVKEISEENYFFKLSNYKEVLTKYISENDFLKPESKKNELLNIIDEFDEISISRLRTALPWGVEVPNDPTQTIYVWFDALINYIVAAGWNNDNTKFNDFWNSKVVQLCGPDNLRFQGHIWQSILSSGGVGLTTKLLVHGTVLDKNGKKISKTVGNVIDPIEEFNQFGLDPIRYYILGGLNTYSNCSWDSNELKSNWNSLANGWGNLVSRALHLTNLFGIDSETPPIVCGELESTVNGLCLEATSLWDNYEIKLAIQKTNDAVSTINRWINDNQPWKTKNPAEIGVLYRLITTINELYRPVIPQTSEIISNGISIKEKIIAIPFIGERNHK